MPASSWESRINAVEKVPPAIAGFPHWSNHDLRCSRALPRCRLFLPRLQLPVRALRVNDANVRAVTFAT